MQVIALACVCGRCPTVTRYRIEVPYYKAILKTGDSKMLLIASLSSGTNMFFNL